MQFEPTPFKDAWIVTLDPIGDDRGYFARAFCRKEFEAHGIEFDVAQCNTSFSKEEGTLRGLHYQADPAAEAKLMRCVQGSMYDVIVDMRPESPTYLQHFGICLSADNLKMLFVPSNFAHGYQTMEPNTAAYYLVDEYYTPKLERGVRYSDPSLGIDWPRDVTVISQKDQNWSLL